MRQTPHENLLLVEGQDDKRVIPELMERNGITWELGPKQYCVEIVAAGGLSQLLEPSFLGVSRKRAGLRRLGLLVDSDTNTEATWLRVSQALSKAGIATNTQALDTPMSKGLVTTGVPRWGVWMMPDNLSTGMLETFLGHLVKPEQNELWEHSKAACDSARDKGAPFRYPTHLDKARIHTFLAWQREPGRQLHQALKHNLLSADCSYAQPFVDWFCQLYEIPRKAHESVMNSG